VDPASGIGIPVAFGAGLISFLSPCVLPLVPGYISAVAGVRDTAEIKARRVIGPSLAFVGTFSAIFIALGLLGQRAIRGALTGSTALHLCGTLITLMGLLFIASPFIPRLAKTWHFESLMARAGKSGPVLTGAAFALAWTPCIGPTLGAIISAAGTSNSSYNGAFLLAIYCAGLGVPFLLAGLAFGKFTSAFNVVRRHYGVVIGVGGVVLVGTGILIFTGQFTVLNQHVSDALNSLGLPNFNSDT
jgi:cytochrome c-type biogenesis protein